MVEVSLVEREAFDVIGRSTWISGEDNEQFGEFWAKAHSDGLVTLLHRRRGGVPGPTTRAIVFGVSRVEADPSDRAFEFMIATEAAGITHGEQPDDAGLGGTDRVGVLERYTVPAATWAVFANRGELVPALIEAEMFAFTQWLPASGFEHSLAPELEVYPAEDPQAVEFWLPVTPV